MQKLNKIERLKSKLKPSDFNLNSVNWDSLDEDTRFYLKNYGIYNIKLRPNIYMLRLRFDGGIISQDEVKLIANIALRENLKVIVTSRAQLELHNIEPSRVFSIYQELKENQIYTYQVLTDNFRAMILDPLDGYAKDSQIDSKPILEEIKRGIIAKDEWIGTIPRKFNTAIIGRYYPSFNPWGQDLLFALAKRGGEFGFNVYVGGKNSEVAKNIDIFSKPSEVSKLFLAIARVYRDYGLRGTRAKTRFYHLIEAIGLDSLRGLIEREYKGGLLNSGELLIESSSKNRDDELEILRYARFGEIEPKELLEISIKASKNNLEIRLSPTQEIWLFKKSLDRVKEGNNLIKVTACAGARYCPLSLWDIKRDTLDLPLEILTASKIAVGFSGCLKGCGRHHHSDIGLVGLRSNAFGETERSIRVFIGSTQSPKPTPARLLFYAIPKREIGLFFRVLVDDFRLSKFERFEEFSLNILNRYSSETLMLWYLLRQLNPNYKECFELFFKIRDEFKLLECLKQNPLYPKEAKEIKEAILELEHTLWDR